MPGSSDRQFKRARHCVPTHEFQQHGDCAIKSFILSIVFHKLLQP